jgi:hypothetical protein
MTYLLAERVRERTLTTGTGTLDLAGTIFANERSFADAFADGDTTRYTLLSGNGVDWEIGDGLYTAGAPDTLTRTPIRSSNANAAIDLVGESQVFSAMPAPVLLVNQGDWSGTAEYAQNSVVRFGDTRYVSSTFIPGAPGTPPVIDGSAKHNGTSGSTPITVTLSTSLPADKIIVLIAIKGAFTAVPTATGLSFSERGTELGGPPFRPSAGGFTIQEFIADAVLPLSGKVITITPSGSTDFSAVAFGVNLANFVYPFDTNSDAVPGFAAGNTVNLTTDGDKLFLIYADVSDDIAFDRTAVPTGFTLIQGNDYVPAQMGVSGRSVTTQQVGVSLVGSPSAADLCLVDALTSGNAPPNVDSRWVPLGQDLGGTDQPANTVYAGPASGADAPPAFRALVSDDLPSPYTNAIVDTYDAEAAMPASQTPAGFAITSNYDGFGEVDFWSLVNVAGAQGFSFKQKLSNTTYRELAYLYGGSAFAEIDFNVNGNFTFFFGADATAGYFGTYSSIPLDFYANNIKRASLRPTASGWEIFGSTSGSIVIDVPAVAGTRTVKLPAGSTDFTATGGAGKSLRQLSAGGAITVENDRYAIAFSSPQTTAYTASQVIGHHRFSRGVTIPANFGAYLGDASQAGGSAVATASTVFSVEKAASATPNSFSQVGTITIAAGTVTPTFASSGGTAIALAQGDVMRIVAPASPDATFAGFYATIIGFGG